jgi:hypothetical protein
MMGLGLALNLSGAFAIAFRVLRGEKLQQQAHDLRQILLTGSCRDDNGSKKVLESLERHHTEYANILCRFLARNVDAFSIFCLMEWIITVCCHAHYARPTDALNDCGSAGFFILLVLLSSVPGVFAKYPQLITRKCLMAAQSTFLLSLAMIQMTSGDIHSRAPQSILRAALCVVVADFRFTLVSNIVFSTLVCAGSRLRHDVRNWPLFAASEVQLMLWISLAHWMLQKSYDESLNDRPSKESASSLLEPQAPLWSLLESNLDAILEIDADLHICGAMKRRKELLEVPVKKLEGRSDSEEAHSSRERPDTASSSRECRLIPASVRTKGDALEGYTLSDFMASSTDVRQLAEAIYAATAEETLGSVQTTSINVHARSGPSRPVRMEVMCVADSLADLECKRYLVSLRGVRKHARLATVGEGSVGDRSSQTRALEAKALWATDSSERTTSPDFTHRLVRSSDEDITQVSISESSRSLPHLESLAPSRPASAATVQGVPGRPHESTRSALHVHTSSAASSQPSRSPTSPTKPKETFPGFSTLVSEALLPGINESRAAVLFFDTLDSSFPIISISKEWIKLFGVSQGSLLNWLGCRLVPMFQVWLDAVVKEALDNEWKADQATHTFRSVTGKHPDGSKFKASLRVTLLDPNMHHDRQQGKYTVMLSAEDLRLSGVKKTGRSSRRPPDHLRQQVAQLPTLAENTTQPPRAGDRARSYQSQADPS